MTREEDEEDDDLGLMNEVRNELVQEVAVQVVGPP
jgi:hypothetical protein